VSLSPDFSKKDINKNIELLISEGYEVVSNASNGDSWESVISLLDEFEFRFERECSVNSHLNSVMFDEKFNQEYEKTLPKISKFYSNISTNKELFKAYKRVLDTDLTQQQTHIVNEAIKGFQLSGIDLDADSQEEFKKIQERLTVLSNTFSNNSLKSTNEWKKSVSKADLPGYTEDQLSKIRKEDGSLEINLQMPVYLDLMTFCENQTLREEVYKAYISRASEIGLTSKKYDNTKVMDEILKLRLKLANLLGFNNYAELSIASKMVESPNQVIDFLDLLINKSQSQALKEFQELESFAGCKINPWDFAFYSEKLKEKKYGFKKSDLTPYFPEEYVLNGLFSLIKELYEISLKEVKEDSYHHRCESF
jgi:oligopeptidase A